MTRVCRNPDVIWDRVDGALVLCHTGTGEFFRLNYTGALIWELIESRSSQAIVEQLCRRYPAEPTPRLEAAVRDCLAALRDNHLLLRTEEEPTWPSESPTRA